jgi:hypothetical protein
MRETNHLRKWNNENRRPRSGARRSTKVRPRRLNGIAWAVDRLSRVRQKAVSRSYVIKQIRSVGWLHFEQVVRYWFEQTKLEGCPYPVQR